MSAGSPDADNPGDRKPSDQGDESSPDKTSDRGDAKTEDDEEEHHGKGLLQRPILLIVGGVILLAAIIGGILFWLHARHYENTDDAFVDTHIVRLAPQIAGQVTHVIVNDNQLVQPGQELVEIDSSDAQTRVAQAQAQRAQAQAQVDNAKVQISVNQAGYQGALADEAAAAATADNAARDLARYQNLQALNPAAVSQQQMDQAQAQARQSQAQLLSAKRTALSRADQVRASRTQVTSGEEQVHAAESQLNEAGINLGYTRIVAPVAGHVAQKTVAAGAYVQPGTQLLAIVPLNVWITANFKETQLALMRVGQPVNVRVDACGKEKVTGHVDSIQRGAGQAFGVLPPENATGNYVKVVQRVPVKIVLDRLPQDCPLGPGMSVEPQVQVR